MMIMNVFPIGLHFQKRDFVPPLDKEQLAGAHDDKQKTVEVAVDDTEAKAFALPLYAYRFF